MRTVLPWRGEFGLGIRYHVPTTYALDGPYRVLIEPGMEALYPGAAEHIEVPRRHDDARAGDPYRTDGTFLAAMRAEWGECVAPKKGDTERRFVPQPFVRQAVGDVDIVVCPRGRRYGASKNWPHWDELVEWLGGKGFSVFAAGAPDSSQRVDSRCAWTYSRFLDASIEAMLRARLVIATDAGLAHLAVLCGRPLLLITCNGLVAPGPVTDEHGHVFRPAYWPVKRGEYYDAANHQRSPLVIWPHWDQVLGLADEVVQYMRAAV